MFGIVRKVLWLRADDGDGVGSWSCFRGLKFGSFEMKLGISGGFSLKFGAFSL
jgi:hypothetical protein